MLTAAAPDIPLAAAPGDRVLFEPAGDATGSVTGLSELPGPAAGAVALPSGRLALEREGAGARIAEGLGGGVAVGRGSGAGASAEALLTRFGPWLVTTGGQTLGITADSGPSPKQQYVADSPHTCNAVTVP